jgi:hypothetical protein
MNLARRTALVTMLVFAAPTASTALASGTMRTAHFPTCNGSAVVETAAGLERRAAARSLGTCATRPTPKSLRLNRLSTIDHPSIP